MFFAIESLPKRQKHTFQQTRQNYLVYNLIVEHNTTEVTELRGNLVPRPQFHNLDKEAG